MEIYQENIFDLFEEENEIPLQIREDTKKGVFVEGLAEKVN